ncbi:MAG: beta-Ala-His dipeptidase [Beduini sp.]
MAVLDQSQPMYKYFEEISQIPRGSFNEGAISDYLVKFAKAHQLKYVQDEMKNVIIYKEASQGYEDHEPVMLQGHIDMVCEKNNDVDHDFFNDPLDLYIEDGFVKARGTTLGADDGFAISYMLSILADPTLKHPPLDCVFTVQEEVGLFGAMNIKAKDIRAKRMIGMDTGGENITCVSSSGGRSTYASKNMTLIDNQYPTFKLTITGLKGGHSGGNIHKELGNANKLAFRMLQKLLTLDDVYLVNVKGGLKDNAIPRECEVVFSFDSSIKFIDKIIAQEAKDIQHELEFSDPNFKYHLSQVEKTQYCFDALSSKETIQFVYLAPNGFKARSMVIDGLTTVSLNLGVIETKDCQLQCHFSLRSPIKSAVEQLTNEITVLASLLKLEVKSFADYPGWNYEENSTMRDILKTVIFEKLNKELISEASHGGLETGVFKGLIPELDIVTMGPHCFGAHTPEEKMDLKSFKRMYDVLLAFLERL